ncbi:MarR family winged helix-turn-helix transcriptional regulator [Arenibaculum sp.]|uniref:MarR family winged helix-turn-helix transcriptional regulator n=1 Tax=Arenibaculum sp. TaxID=2865862 RepID=UPI002E1094C2|nr:MarR family winged helix-turn-helix transcriptional regulator [Arenibaculum sp.]
MVDPMCPSDAEGLRFDQVATLFHRRLSRAIGVGLRRRGYSLPALSVLGILWKGDGLPQNEIARRAGITTPSCSAALAALQRAGLVHRRRCEHDRRRSEVWLTERGRAARVPIDAAVGQVLEGALAGTPPDDVARARAVMMTMLGNLDRIERRTPDRIAAE